jgi:hypothetical protein
MRDYRIEVYLQFPAMNRLFPVRVSPRDVFMLDRNAERSVRADGAVVYTVPRSHVPMFQHRHVAGAA